MQARLYNDLTRQSLSETLGAGSLSFPLLVQGSDLTLSFRFQARVDGRYIETPRTVSAVRATIGRTDARPTSGTFRLRVGLDETPAIAHGATASALLTAVGGIWTGIDEVIAVDGSWLIASAAALPEAEQFENMLSPLSFVRQWSQEQEDGTWITEIRLQQAPVAFTDTFAVTLPPPPEIDTIQEGADVDGILIPEVQALRIDPWFSGVYRLRRGLRVSGELSIEDGPEEIEEAIQSLLTAAEIADGAELTVRNPADGSAWITFGGSLSGVDEDPLEVEVVDAPAGDPTINLSLATAALAASLRGKARETYDFELTWTVRDETAAPDNEEIIRTATGFRGTVTIVPELGPETLGVHPEINWTDPPEPRRYPPFSRDQIFNGTRNIALALGPGLSHTITHNLGTDEIAHLALRENTAGGALLVHGTDYTVEILNEDQVRITIDAGYGTVADEDLAVVIVTAGPEDHFLAHTHTLGDNPELAALIADLQARLAVLEDLAPTGALAAVPASPSGRVAQWALPSLATVFPLREPVEIPEDGGIAAVDLTGIRQSGLLPAVHTSTAPVPLPAPLPAGPAEAADGVIYRNETGGTVILPGGKGRRSYQVPDDGLVAAYWDSVSGIGRWYPVTLQPGTNTYHPTQFELPLWELLLTEDQLRARRRLRVEWGFEAAILRSSTRAQWELVVEYGAITEDGTPDPTGRNLLSIDWDEDDPALRQRILAGPIPTVHRFGFAVSRAANGDLSAERSIYQAAASCDAPASATFAVRARLVRFDTVDQPDLLGFLAVRGLDATTAPDGEDAFVGEAWIE